MKRRWWCCCLYVPEWLRYIQRENVKTEYKRAGVTKTQAVKTESLGFERRWDASFSKVLTNLIFHLNQQACNCGGKQNYTYGYISFTLNKSTTSHTLPCLDFKPRCLSSSRPPCLLSNIYMDVNWAQHMQMCTHTKQYTVFCISSPASYCTFNCFLLICSSRLKLIYIQMSVLFLFVSIFKSVCTTTTTYFSLISTPLECLWSTSRTHVSKLLALPAPLILTYLPSSSFCWLCGQQQYDLIKETLILLSSHAPLTGGKSYKCCRLLSRELMHIWCCSEYLQQ